MFSVKSASVISSPRRTFINPFNISQIPAPPLSITPASFSTDSSSGVLFNDSAASSQKSSQKLSIVLSSVMFALAYTDASLITVSIVPSTGTATELYANSTPRVTASPNSFTSAVPLPSKPLAMPAKNCDNITPEFPLAPKSIPFAASEEAASSDDTSAFIILDAPPDIV